MEDRKNTILNYGILASISWNSNDWADNPTTEDLKASKYDYVKDNAHMHESLNFGHDIFPAEDDEYYIGYTPMFNRPPDIENSRNVEVVFFVSSDYKNSNKKNIVGLYGFPVFGEWMERTAENKLYKIYDSGNIKSHKENIIYFKNKIIIDNDSVQKNQLLPEGKKISQQGFNYLNSNNVYNLIKLALHLNPNNKKLSRFVERFPSLEKLSKTKFDFEDFIYSIEDITADSLSDIRQLEKKMRNKQPEIKQKISSYIERGTISNKVKRINNYKCSVCEALGQQTISFKKPNGELYIETHHVEPVSTAKSGVLGLANLMTVCANHHRQLHYGNAELLENNDVAFAFNIDGKHIKINKISIKE